MELDDQGGGGQSGKSWGVEKDEQNALYEKNKTQTKTTSLINGLLENLH